jgi:dephospho-CoA kinase
MMEECYFPGLIRNHGRALPHRGRRPFILGLTGSIGMGKSTVAAMFEGEGVPVFDADAVVRALQGPAGKLIPMIEAVFPGTTSAKGVDRAALGAHVLGNAHSMRQLESLIHPAVALEQKAFLVRNRARRLVVLDIPLLLEKSGWRRVDAVIVVSAPAWMQRQRVLARPGMTQAKFRHFLSLQMPDSRKKAHAHWVLDTGGAKGQTHAAVRYLISCISASKAYG